MADADFNQRDVTSLMVLVKKAESRFDISMSSDEKSSFWVEMMVRFLWFTEEDIIIENISLGTRFKRTRGIETVKAKILELKSSSEAGERVLLAECQKYRFLCNGLRRNKSAT